MKAKPTVSGRAFVGNGFRVVYNARIVKRGKRKGLFEVYYRRGYKFKCGNDKKRGFSFCYQCYKSLPFDMQRALYRKLGDGYEEAYEDAVKYLE